MKSNGKAQKIHVSEQAYMELNQTKEFNIKFRGIVPLKNRGDMKEIFHIPVQLVISYDSQPMTHNIRVTETVQSVIGWRVLILILMKRPVCFSHRFAPLLHSFRWFKF